jgi:two-component system osmolarity sensor histidine kinase EnvZ
MIRINKMLNRLKPQSAVWRTTLVVGVAVVVSQYLSIAFFWTNLYLPEIRQHAHYSAVFVAQLRDAEHIAAKSKQQAAALQEVIRKSTGLEIVRDPAAFPKTLDRPVAEIFLSPFETQLSQDLNEPVDVYFAAKPTPRVWINVPSMSGVWIREPLVFYAQYSPFIVIAWVIGVPLLTVIAIVILVRQLNRPLKRLQLAALRVGKGQHSTMLEVRSGPMEIRAVNRAFNQMTQEIQQAAKERAFMLAGISHDLRTPLTRLRLTAEMLGDREMAEGIVLDIQDMDAILDQFIAYMRDGSDEPVEVASLNLLISEVVAQFSAEGEVSFAPGELPDMALKRLSLKRMLGNLISNALRYGGAPVEVSTEVSGRDVLLQVRDHGPGIEEAQLPELLQPFTRGEAARTTLGSGLGLAIISRIVKMHHGRLDIRNHPEQGLEVSIRLPLARRPGRAGPLL